MIRIMSNRLLQMFVATAALFATGDSRAETLDQLYLATLSRQPNEGEVKAALAHVEKNANKRLAWEDVHWALINSKEFLFRH